MSEMSSCDSKLRHLKKFVSVFTVFSIFIKYANEIQPIKLKGTKKFPKFFGDTRHSVNSAKNGRRTMEIKKHSKA